ncbi:uncharacterized protein LAJ45_06867 [Morchella importuna]|uniref:uncharacterized protein n=1 Tax=Morchella importuna TaxID=1174673 RepID=UPI001E8E98D8|nr:uncharacterized protein LAJ45_06867 [Morchella importuna]KAH8148893.1 hypothetical protein LAJ45_06867 [Morchella importuna]
MACADPAPPPPAPETEIDALTPAGPTPPHPRAPAPARTRTPSPSPLSPTLATSRTASSRASYSRASPATPPPLPARRPAILDRAMTLALAHDIRATDMSYTPYPSPPRMPADRDPGARRRCIVGTWVAGMKPAHGAAVATVRGGRVERMLVDIARERSGEVPRGGNVEETMELLMDRGPRPIAPWDAYVRPED